MILIDVSQNCTFNKIDFKKLHQQSQGQSIIVSVSCFYKVNTTEYYHQQAATFWLLGRSTLLCGLRQKAEDIVSVLH